MTTEYYVGIDNSNTGAIAMIDSDGVIISLMKMPLITEIKTDEVDYRRIIDFIHENGGGEHNTRVMLEEPHRFAKGINAVRIMWSSFHRIKVSLDMIGMKPDAILPVQWQSKMLEVFGDKKSKEWAAKRVSGLYGQEVVDEIKKQFRRKPVIEGINDAILIAEFCRRAHLGIDFPRKTCK